MAEEKSRHRVRWGWASAASFLGLAALWISYPQAAQPSETTAALPPLTTQEQAWLTRAQTCATSAIWADRAGLAWMERETQYMQSQGQISPTLMEQALANDPEAMYRVGVLVLSFGSKPNLNAGFEYLLGAAIAGHPQAMHEVGLAYLHGTLNQLQDPIRARSWLTRAAPSIPESAYALYWMVRDNGGDVSDITMARHELLRAGSACYVHATMNIYLHLQRGEIFHKDEDSAAQLKDAVERFLMSHQDVAIDTQDLV